VHKPQARVVLCTYCTFRVSYFQVSYPIELVYISGFYIGLINFWVIFFGLIYKTLETISLVLFHSMSIHSNR
jgi:hypothetical protein